MNIARLNRDDAEIFFSLQGEGPRTGTPATFLRLAGCNLACQWCDTKHSWGRGLSMTPGEVVERLRGHHCRSLVITGGEPLLQQEELEELLRLLPADVYVEVETNGTLVPSPALVQRIDQWNVSPKLAHAGNDKARALCPEVLAAFAALPHSWFKFVVQREDDWDSIAALGLPQERIILMPCATTRGELHAARPTVAEMCLRHGVRLGDRLHLVLWDDRKGV